MSLSLSTSELDKIQASAHEASENWVHSLTSFLNEEDASKVESRLKELGDVQYIKIGRIFPEGSRSGGVGGKRGVALSQKETESEFCSLLQIENIQQGALPKSASGSNAWPALWRKIGTLPVTFWRRGFIWERGMRTIGLWVRIGRGGV